MSSSPLLAYSSFPWTLSFPAPAIHLLPAHYILHTYVAQDAWRAFLCSPSLIRGWQSHLMPGRHRSRRTRDRQRAESLSGLSGYGAAAIHEKFIKIWLLLKDRSAVIVNWNVQFAQNEVLHLSSCISCQIFFFFSVIPAELLLLLFSGRIPHWLKRVPPPLPAPGFIPSIFPFSTWESWKWSFLLPGVFHPERWHQRRPQGAQLILSCRPGRIGHPDPAGFWWEFSPYGNAGKPVPPFCGVPITPLSIPCRYLGTDRQMWAS